MLGGSSPLTRGKPSRTGVMICGSRLIPAHAGKTWSVMVLSLSVWAHPRSRGENTTNTLKLAQTGGSSPLTRGKQNCSRETPPFFRLIPAHAGKTLDISRCGYFLWAHPRSRGENHTVPIPTHTHNGSSPLTRGKHSQGHLSNVRLGLIPAHAGKTDSPCGLCV